MTLLVIIVLLWSNLGLLLVVALLSTFWQRLLTTISFQSANLQEIGHLISSQRILLWMVVATAALERGMIMTGEGK